MPLGAESRILVKRSELAVAPASGYLPAAEEDYDEEESLAGYSADGLSLPGYSEGTDELTRDNEGLTTMALVETTTSLEEGITTTISPGDEEQSGFYRCVILIIQVSSPRIPV